MNATEPSLYDRLGGELAIDTLTKAFYDRVLADIELKPFFEHTSMDRLRAMQHEFLCAALDGPVTYTGKPLAYAHQGRGITAQHFAKFVQYFLDTLRDFGVSDEDAYEVISRLNTRANEVIGNSY
jgi:hemoglobin